MPWRTWDVSDQRLEFVLAASAPGACMASVCREYGVSRQTGYTWLERFRQDGAKAVLCERSRRPRGSPQKTPEDIAALVTSLRREKPDWGARKIWRLLCDRHPEWDPRVLSVTTAHRILDRAGLIAPEERRRPAVKRFERQEPNELWQMDFKGPQGFNNGIGPLSVQDDYSRYVLLLKHVGNTQALAVRSALEPVFQQCGLPLFLLIDHGTPWYNSWSPWGWTELTVWIARQGVRLLLSGVRHPQTQGKIERMHGALQRAIRKRKMLTDQQIQLDEFRYEYNYVRPHDGIGMATPATRWHPSSRVFQPNPREWEYPAGWEVRRLGGQGQLNWNGKRWEISRALRGQLVGLQRLDDTVLIDFCNLPLREINPRTAQNLVLPANPFRDLRI